MTINDPIARARSTESCGVEVRLDVASDWEPHPTEINRCAGTDGPGSAR